MLQLSDIDLFYGPVQALQSVSLTVNAGEIVALIGPNGAGKTSVLKTVSGLLQPHRGTVCFEGRDLRRMSPESIVSRGIAHVPEGRRIFPGLTVWGNLQVATAGWRRRGQSMHHELQQVFILFPRLAERRRQLGWSLSGGEQQMLAVARGLMARPKLLMLDEPSLGLAPKLVKALFQTISSIRRTGTAILLVEQNARAALAIATRGYVLARGRVQLSGPAGALRADERLKEIYLGVESQGGAF